jgi:OOP family OmpA-OmpF porin
MPTIGVHTDTDRIQKRWVLGALGIAFLIHLGVAGAMGWYKIPGMEVPFSHSAPTGPFTIKTIEMRPDALKPQPDDAISKMPAVEPPQNPAQFNLDPNVVEKALQAPQPALAMPTVPAPNKVIAATDLTQQMPLVESDTARMSAEIAKVEPAMSGNPVASSTLAEQLINSNPGPVQDGTAGGTPSSGNGSQGKLPGFADLAPGFKASGPTVANLPDPVLLRLPADVLFDFDSATLKPEAGPLLSQAIGLITKYPQAEIHIDGYSDSIGKPDYNKSLSGQRAQVVQDWLRQRIPQADYNFHSQGHGSTNFIVSDQGSIEQQQPNRRVEILVQALKP